MRIARVGYFLLLSLLTIFTFGFVDFSVPLTVPFHFNRMVYDARMVSAIAYGLFVMLLFGSYIYFLFLAYKRKITLSYITGSTVVVALLLLCSYPAFSNDIYNYSATARITYLYQENPYIVMPSEVTNEPMLLFLHAANKTALYGPSWILLTAIPYFLGMGNMIQTVFMFKLMVMASYLLTAYLIWQMSNKNVVSVVLFALNPLVLMESLISAHNDLVMMFFALLSFYLLKKRIGVPAVVSLMVSIGIKYATIVLVPVYLYVWVQQRRKKTVHWQRIWLMCAAVMFFVFCMSPLREEMYPWYFQWVIVFASLVPQYTVLMTGVIGLSFGLSLRFLPYVYIRDYTPQVLLMKQVLTGVPFALSIVGYYAYIMRKYNKR